MMLWRVITDTMTETAAQLTRELLDDPAIRAQLRAAVERELRAHLDLATKVEKSTDDVIASAKATIAEAQTQLDDWHKDDRRKKMGRELAEMRAQNRRLTGAPFRAYLLGQVVFIGWVLGLAGVLLLPSWIVVRTTDNLVASFTVLAVSLLVGVAYLQYASSRTTIGVRLTDWLVKIAFPK